MRQMKRLACLALAVLMLACLTPNRAGAARQVYFLAVNEQVYPLEDETMPFWLGGVLYVPYTAFSDNDLGIYYNRSRDKNSAMLSKQRFGALIFDLVSNTIYDNITKQTYSGYAVSRGGVVFFPVDVVCKFFALSYTYTRVTYGHLIRVRNDSSQLSDDVFIDAAGIAMANRYAAYERSHADAAAETPAVESTPTPPVQSEDPPIRRTVYAAFTVTDAGRTAELLPSLGGERTTFLFSLSSLEGADDLVRRLVINGHSIALRLDGSAGAEAALRELEEANRRLWAAASLKTRLVRVENASEDTARALERAGCRVLRFSLDYSAQSTLPSASRLSSRILSSADAGQSRCALLLGTDEKVLSAKILSALFISLRAGNCTFAGMTEVDG